MPKTRPVSGKTRRSKAVSRQPSALTAVVLDVEGKTKGRVKLPPELFAAKINPKLMAQAVRVYLANQRRGQAATKTRGEVEGSTRKIYRQKGTGRARHGAIRAPIFVGGGIVFGPKPRDFSLHLPVKSKRQALASALTAQYRDGKVVIVDGWDNLEPKTRVFDKALTAVGAHDALLVVPAINETVRRGVGNLPTVRLIPAANLNTYELLASKKVVLFKDSLAILKNKLTKI